MRKRRDPETISRMREELQDAFDAGQLDLADAVRAIRKIIGVSQAEYAAMVGVAARTLIDLERRVGNPTLETLLKIGRPFNLTVVYRSAPAINAKPLIKHD